MRRASWWAARAGSPIPAAAASPTAPSSAASPASRPLLDNPVGAREQRLGNPDAELSGGREVERQCDLAHLHDGDRAGVAALEQLVDEARQQLEVLGDRRPV